MHEDALKQVRADFNPSGSLDVDSIKRLAAALISVVNEKLPPSREASQAKTEIEAGAMWAVKAATAD